MTGELINEISVLWSWLSPAWLLIGACLAAYLVAFWGGLETRSWWFAGSLAGLFVAYVSPVYALADGVMFTAHMIQHLVLLLIVPLCFLLSLPRARMAEWLARPKVEPLGRLLSFAPVGWALGLSVMWVWHVPTLCTASLQSSWLGVFQDVTFVVAGLAFWWPVFSPVKAQRLAPASAALYLFTACVGCTLLGIYLTFTPISVCPVFARPAAGTGLLEAVRAGGFSAGMDQRLGGLLMWVPPCVLYAGAIVAVCRRWYAGDEEAAATGESLEASESVK
ncbi:MAG: cytochrome c oxidase assembly protein [Verrucomicrobiota bacterium]